jgi:hypothetical protein
MQRKKDWAKCRVISTLNKYMLMCTIVPRYTAIEQNMFQLPDMEMEV